MNPILKAARDLIADPDRWTQGPAARDADGRPVDPTEPAAIRWCVWGAIHHVGGNSRDYDELSAAARRITNESGAIDVNEKLGHAAILNVFDEALRT